MPREQSKCREWEKERRNRLNEGFTSLSKLLPLYDPSINISKIEILKNAASYIEELQTKIKELISQNNVDTVKKIKGEEYKKLQERVRKLLCKNEHLCALLRQAKISIPPGCSLVKKFKCPLYWSEKFTPEQAKTLQKKDSEKENDSTVKKAQSRKFPNKKPTKVGQTTVPKHRKAILNRSDSKKLKSKKKKVKPLAPSKCVIVLSQPSTQPCYVITNAPSNNLVGGTSTVITNSSLVTSPLVSSKPTKPISSVTPLGAGTLILANGTIMPVLPQTVLPIPPQIITRPPIILVKNSVTINNPIVASSQKNQIVSTTNKTLQRIKPKYCLTKTTQVNKVPIPALTSRYSNPDVVLKKVESKIVKNKSEKKLEKDDKKENEKRKEQPEDSSENETKKIKIIEDKVVTTENSQKETNTNNDNIKVSEPEMVTQNEKTEEVNQEKIPEPKEKIIEEPVQKPESKKPEENLELNINHSELSNDIFASLQVPPGCQNPESTSPTAAFLLAFPLVSTGVKVTEVTEEDNPESQRETPTLLQIGTMDTTKPTQSESLTPSLLNLDNLSFFSSKDIGFYNSFEGSIATTSTTASQTNNVNSETQKMKTETGQKKAEYQRPQQMQMQQRQKQNQQNLQIQQQQKIQQSQPIQQQNLQQNIQQQPQQLHQTQQTIQQNQSLQAQQPQQNIQQTIQQNQPLPQQSQTLQSHQISQQKNQLVPCFDNPIPFGTANSTNYQSKPHETKQSVCSNYQKPFCNNFNDSLKVSTCSYSTNAKSYPEPLYTNSSTYTYSNTSETNYYYKDIPKSDNRSYYSLNYENYADYRKNDSNSTYFPTSNYYPNTNKFSNNQKKSTQRPPINWMTTPDNRLQNPTEYVLPQFTKESEFYSTNSFTNSQTTYFNTNPVYSNDVTSNQEPRKSLDLALVPPVNTYQRNEVEDNQFSWSPTKIPQFLEPPHNFSTLPTLVGDLALGNTLNFNEQKEKCQKKDSRRLKNYESNNQTFLSVSQLVDPNKEVVPARTTTRRNSGNRSSAKKVQQKSRKEAKEFQANKVENSKGMKMGYSSGSSEVFCDSNNKNRQVAKNSYSAEALIGHQMQPEQKRQQNYNNKPISVSSFLHDNLIPYFPTVDLPQDNSYQNQNYQPSTFTHNFPSTFQNNNTYTNTFIPSTTITSTYNFMHDVPTHEYPDLFPPIAKDKNPQQKNNRQQCPTTPKKSKRKQNDLPGIVDFPFLSIPGSINSPILPDDFHTHTGFLQPPTPQLYPCKNPFTKPNDLGGGSLLPLPPVPGRGNIQPEISPINNGGTSLTNFNLSTIFPEFNNKGGVDPYSDVRVKDRSYTSSVQVSFNDKPTFSFSYINCTTSQYNQ